MGQIATAIDDGYRHSTFGFHVLPCAAEPASAQIILARRTCLILPRGKIWVAYNSIHQRIRIVRLDRRYIGQRLYLLEDDLCISIIGYLHDSHRASFAVALARDNLFLARDPKIL